MTISLFDTPDVISLEHGTQICRNLPRDAVSEVAVRPDTDSTGGVGSACVCAGNTVQYAESKK